MSDTPQQGGCQPHPPVSLAEWSNVHQRLGYLEGILMSLDYVVDDELPGFRERANSGYEEMLKQHGKPPLRS